KKFHPDVNSGDKFFEDRFKEILEAYETLLDPRKRKTYDDQLLKKVNLTERELEDLIKKYYSDTDSTKTEFQQRKSNKSNRKGDDFKRNNKENKKSRIKFNFKWISVNRKIIILILLPILIITSLILYFIQNDKKFSNNLYWSKCDEHRFHNSKNCLKIRGCSSQIINGNTADYWDLARHNCINN